ncbi:MAG: hypothetical protein GX804_08665 [Lentisphaerae bacterium]|jgi:lysophospholipase L1-like esterase|nr:hypothetical protein [Lentisphaerota bacterium]
MKHSIPVGILSIALTTQILASVKPVVKTPFVFTDEDARIAIEACEGEIACHVSAITTKGFGPKRTEIVQIINGEIGIKPLAEGIHRVDLGPPVNDEVRFLAMTLPDTQDAGKIAEQLPKRGRALLAGEPFTLLLMGDSVSHTGDYGLMLARILERATGNTNITVVKRTYPGRSIDATVRHFERDTRNTMPDLGLLMYGLNDQISFVPLPAFLEQYEWVSSHLLERFGADTVFLQPTPHIKMLRSEPDGTISPSKHAFRTIGFARAIADLGTELDIPVASTFHAIWGSGENSVNESAMAMWPLYPESYSAQFSTLLESTGRGDVIHPNALGHLQIAKAVFKAITGVEETPTLYLSGTSRWTANGVVSQINVSNCTDKVRTGRLEPYAPTAATISEQESVPYTLQPGESLVFEATWTEATLPEDLLRFPNDVYLSQQQIPISVVDFSDNSSYVHSVLCPFEVEGDFIARRTVIEGQEIIALLQTKDGIQERSIQIPVGSPVGRIPVVEKLADGNRTGYAVAEVVYTAVGIAPVSEAKVDGQLEEWEGQPSVPIGRSCQARGWRGHIDNRLNPEEAQADFFFKSGKDGIYVAIRGHGVLTNDTVTIFFDPRPFGELGTAGPYYWANFSFAPGGRVKAVKGETSASRDGLHGVWLATETGLEAEFFIPYTLMDASAWHESGDLGMSIIWRHKGVNGLSTRLTWSEDGHEWNPRWYGIVQRIEPGTNPTQRYVVRVK